MMNENTIQDRRAQGFTARAQAQLARGEHATPLTPPPTAGDSEATPLPAVEGSEVSRRVQLRFASVARNFESAVNGTGPWEAAPKWLRREDAIGYLRRMADMVYFLRGFQGYAEGESPYGRLFSYVRTELR